MNRCLLLHSLLLIQWISRLEGFVSQPWKNRGHCHRRQQHRQPASYLSAATQPTPSSGNTGPTNATSANVSSTSSSLLKKQTTSSFTEGIGGQGGASYDVNKLKKNLLQETMLAYKNALITLLNTPTSTEQEIVEKLSALVEGNPIRTTTDSNLLDGTWALAYQSKHSNVGNLNDFSSYQRLQPRKADKITTPAMKRISGKGSMFYSVQQSFCLEHLEDDDDPFVVEQKRYFGGIYCKRRRSAVEALSRRSIRFRPQQQTRSFLGNLVSFQTKVKQTKTAPIELKIIYADVNLCITSRGDRLSSNYEVYTKNEAWLDKRESFKRKISFTTAWLADAFGRYLPRLRRKKLLGGEKIDPILREIHGDSAYLRVLKLGSTQNEDDEAWESNSDPFVHLSSDERQEALKAMSVRDIEKAGILQGKSSPRLFSRWMPKRFRRRRRTFFNTPDHWVGLHRSTKEKGFTSPPKPKIEDDYTI